MKKLYWGRLFLALLFVALVLLAVKGWGMGSARQCALQNAKIYEDFSGSHLFDEDLSRNSFSDEKAPQALNHNTLLREVVRCAEKGAKMIRNHDPKIDNDDLRKIRRGLDQIAQDCVPFGIYGKNICPYIGEPNGQDDSFPCLPPTSRKASVLPTTRVNAHASTNCPGCAAPATMPTPVAVPTPIVESSIAITKAGKSIGRLEIMSKDHSFAQALQQPCDVNPPEKPFQKCYFWSTGALVGADVVATSCHSIEPLLTDDRKDLHLDGAKLLIDFGEDSLQHDKANEFEILELLACPETKGLDVALLRVAKTALNMTNMLPAPATLDHDPPPDLSPDDSVPGLIIGYADLEHPIDKVTADVYSPYRAPKTHFAKFVSLDLLIGTNKCMSKPKVFLDTGTTTVGESGAVVFRLDTNNSFVVTAFHICCSAFFQESTARHPHEALACSQVERTQLNQAVSAWSVRQDPKLCQYLDGSCNK